MAARELTFMRTPRGGRQRHGRREVNDRALLHQGHGAQRRALVTLLQNPLEDLVQADRRDDECVRVLDRSREEAGTRTVGKVLKPARWVDDVHLRSRSRGTLVSRPRRNPRSDLAGRTGTNSTRPSYSNA